MALFHKATLVPTKAEMLTAWVPTQTWSPDDTAPLNLVGAFRFDDPEGVVGIETFLVEIAGVTLQVPVTYRPEPLEGAEQALITEMHHSALGPRWVYDALHEPCYLTMLAAVTLTGQGEALGMVELDGRWHIAPANVRIQGGGWTDERASVHGFEPVSANGQIATFANERFGLTVHRRLAPTAGLSLNLTATWPGQPAGHVLATISER